MADIVLVLTFFFFNNVAAQRMNFLSFDFFLPLFLTFSSGVLGVLSIQWRLTKTQTACINDT